MSAPQSAAVEDTSSAAALESEPDERKDREPEDTVGLTHLWWFVVTMFFFPLIVYSVKHNRRVRTHLLSTELSCFYFIYII